MTNNKTKIVIKHFTDNVFSRIFISVIGLAAAGITIFLFFQERAINLEYQILTNTNVFDLNADVSDLDVTYDSTSLKKGNENIKITTIKVINTGNEDILKSYFDKNAPIGLVLQNGRIIEKPELIEFSDSYLEQHFNVIYDYPDSILFSDVILEKNEYVTLKFLILHRVDEIPIWNPFGKIAGQKEISINLMRDNQAEVSFLEKTFGGSFSVQLVRLIVYSLGFSVMAGFLIATIAGLTDYFNKRKRKKIVNAFIQREEYEYRRMDAPIFDRFEESGKNDLIMVSRLIDDKLLLNIIYKTPLADIRELLSSNHNSFQNATEESLKSEWNSIKELISDGLIIEDNDILTINNSMKQTLESFIKFLNSKEQQHRYRNSSHSSTIMEGITSNDNE